MHSPTKNQHMTSVVTRVLSQASRTVTFFQFLDLNNRVRSPIALGISAGVGGLNSDNTPDANNLRKLLDTLSAVVFKAVTVDIPLAHWAG